jgi:hypothetical protein
MTTVWYAAADAWQDLASRLESQADRLDQVDRGLADSWKGEAGDAARVALADLRARTAALRLPALRTAELLRRHASVVAFAPLSLALLGYSDLRTATGIASLELPTGRPVSVHAWWSSLSAADRDRLLTTEPARIGMLDGIPAADRDRANRLLLQRELSLPHSESARLGLAALQSRLTDGVLLLGLDTSGDGRAIVAYGDPDHAANVLTFVPGMHSALDPTITGNLDRTSAMAVAAAQADPTAKTSAVMWLGYDTPDGLWEAAQAKYADDARAALHDFQEGLAATHDGEIGEQSVVGYSYGALVVGETARDNGIRADDLVFLGSAGAGVPAAADLNVDPSTVWAASADNDVVGLAAPSVRQLLWEQIWPRYMGDPMPDLWHGHNPADPGFGGNVFAAADRPNPIDAHLSYWDAGNPALENLGRIAAGRDDSVTRP